MKQKLKKDFIIFWLGQFISTFGSSMTSFAVSIWIYTTNQNVMYLSLSTIAIIVPRMIVSIVASPFIDRFDKKKILLYMDIGAGLCSLLLLVLIRSGSLELWHVYLVNVITSMLSGMQKPTSDVVITHLVSKHQYVKAGGMQSFASSMSEIFAPIIATSLLALLGIQGVIIFDLITLVFACITLYAGVNIPNIHMKERNQFTIQTYIKDLLEGYKAIVHSDILRKLVVFMGIVNLFAGMTYYNLLTPMILARSDFNQQTLMFVNSAIGIGGIVGGLLVSILPNMKSKTAVIFICSFLSFLLGDTLLALGSTVIVWSIAAFFSGIFLPLLNANESYIWRTSVPVELQGRVFSFKYAIQSGMIPLGVILGGALAQYIFEPYMLHSNNVFTYVLDSQSGSGIALMFFITGCLGIIISLIGYMKTKTYKDSQE